MPDLQNFILSLPIIGMACVIHRTGYVNRYKGQYQERLWLMCKTTYSILIERTAKFADDNNRKLEVFFEPTGKKEDRAIKQYARDLKRVGPPFNETSSSDYRPLQPDNYKRIVVRQPLPLRLSTAHSLHPLPDKW